MQSDDLRMGRIELEKQSSLSVLNVVRDCENDADREMLEEIRDMLRAIIDHFGVPYGAKSDEAMGKDS